MGSNGKNNGKQWKNNNRATAHVGPHPEAPAFAKASAGRLECNLKLHC
jgi:hypothetical protein